MLLNISPSVDGLSGTIKLILGVPSYGSPLSYLYSVDYILMPHLQLDFCNVVILIGIPNEVRFLKKNMHLHICTCAQMYARICEANA